ncbi:MAG: 1-phosphofructokinase [Monoglobaceae bacterium]
MIYTVTLNPALDYVMDADKLEEGRTNRSHHEKIMPGGKGLNVSAVLTNLGIENTALGFIGGFTGAEIKRRFEALGGRSDFIELADGISRINVKIRAKTETEINAAGPKIDDESAERLFEKTDMLKSGDTLVLAGSIPASLPDSLYSDIMCRLSGRGIRTAVDAEGKLLLETLRYRPYVIKPNHHELGDIFGVSLSRREEAVSYAMRLRGMGAENVLVSMAGEGAVLAASDGEVYESAAPKGRLVNSVGAGDSMLAGFIAGTAAGLDMAHAFKLAVAAGSASAFSENLASRGDIEKIFGSFEVSRI